MEYNKASIKVHVFIDIYRNFLDKLFLGNQHRINATVISQQLKNKEIDIIKVKEFLGKLPEGQWEIKTFIDNLEGLNEIFGISDDEIHKASVYKINKRDVVKVRWHMIVDSMTEYSKFSSEFYDALKYNKAKLTVGRLKLMNELMKIFKYIKETSSKLFQEYENKQYSKTNLRRFNSQRIAIEFFMLRLLYLFMNMKNDEEYFLKYSKLLGLERISIVCNAIRLPRYS